MTLFRIGAILFPFGHSVAHGFDTGNYFLARNMRALICISCGRNDRRAIATAMPLSILFLFPSIREYMQCNFKASRHPLRRAQENALLAINCANVFQI